MDDPGDNAAVTVMAYGLRQKAENRNLESEKKGINTFKNIYGYHPASTEDWNIMQAITYSGAARGIDLDLARVVDRTVEIRVVGVVDSIRSLIGDAIELAPVVGLDHAGSLGPQAPAYDVGAVAELDAWLPLSFEPAAQAAAPSPSSPRGR